MAASGTHGGVEPVDVAVWLGPDSALALVTADLDVWLAAHPCDCEALCVCDDEPGLGLACGTS